MRASPTGSETPPCNEARRVSQARRAVPRLASAFLGGVQILLIDPYDVPDMVPRCFLGGAHVPFADRVKNTEMVVMRLFHAARIPV